jgi:enoyl-CoA hydratase
MSQKSIIRDDTAGLATITLNRPEKLNALNIEMFILLEQYVDQLRTQTASVGCVLLRGAGKAFCAGADLTLAEGEPDEDAYWRTSVIRKLSELPQPVIVAIHGLCITGGIELALGADIILASTSASFSDTHGKWGFVAAWGATQRLPQAVGLAHAKEMTWTSRRYSAMEAQAMGLVNRCFSDAVFESEVEKFTRDILNNSWHSNFESKTLMNATRRMTLEEGLPFELKNHPGRSADSAERVARFLKR